MADINTLKDSYFFQSADAQQLPGATVPQTFSDSKITPVIDCVQFNQEVESALQKVGQGNDAVTNAGDFVFIANWWLGLSGGTFRSAKLFGPGLQVVDDPRAGPDPYTLDGPQGTKVLRDILKELAQRGVDVRVMGWVSLGIMDMSFIRLVEAAQSMARINALSMQSIKDLREQPELEKKALMNVIAHAGGGVHTKCIIVGTNSEAVGFTGGLDFQMGRWSQMYHTNETWHDVVAKIEGPAVVGLYDWYRQLWNENISRPPRHIRFENQTLLSYVGETADLTLGAHAFQTLPKGKHHVQSLRTVPQLNYKPFKLVPTPGPITFAPTGLFEFRNALKKAIANAQTYIYIEDQSFWSREVMEWINDSVLQRPQLRVVLLAPGGADPNDPKFPDAILCNSINAGLLKHANQNQLDQLTSQVSMFRRISDQKHLLWCPVSEVETGTLTQAINRQARQLPDGTWTEPPWLPNQWVPAIDGPHSRLKTTIPGVMNQNDLPGGSRYELRSSTDRFPVIGNEAALETDPKVLYVKNIVVKNPPGMIVPTLPMLPELVYVLGITVHSKTTLIDDHWAVIGSANIMRRSLYTDFEHCVSFLDEDDLVVKEYRKMLWDDHFRHGVPAHFDDIQEALNAWEPTWGTPGSITHRPPELERVSLPIEPNQLLAGKELRHYDRFDDPDSREKW